jgi:hypothetical protein
MTSTNYQFDKIIVGSDIRAILLAYITKRPLFLVNYKEAKVCDFYYTPFFIDSYQTKSTYNIIFDKEKKLNSFEHKWFYPKNIVELDLSLLLSADGLLYSGFTGLKLISDNEFLLFGRKNLTKVKFDHCIMTEPSFEISFLETEPVDRESSDKLCNVYDYFSFEKQDFANTFKIFPGDIHCWVLREDFSEDFTQPVDVLIVTKKQMPPEEVINYPTDIIKIALKEINNYKYRKLFPTRTLMKYSHYREIENPKRDFIYQNTKNITFFYKSDLDIIKRFSNESK